MYFSVNCLIFNIIAGNLFLFTLNQDLPPGAVDKEKCGGCAENGYCAENPPGKFACSCLTNFNGANSDPKSNCIDTNECLPAKDVTYPCDPKAECANTVGSFSCSCTAGFQGTGQAGGGGCSPGPAPPAGGGGGGGSGGKNASGGEGGGEDLHPLCSFWAEKKECFKNPGYMEFFCPKACRGSGGDGGNASKDGGGGNGDKDGKGKDNADKDGKGKDSADKGGTGKDSPDKDDKSKGNCTNTHGLCKFWAKRDQCFENAVWMSENCKKACGTCNKDGCIPCPPGGVPPPVFLERPIRSVRTRRQCGGGGGCGGGDSKRNFQTFQQEKTYRTSLLL